MMSTHNELFENVSIDDISDVSTYLRPNNSSEVQSSYSKYGSTVSPLCLPSSADQGDAKDNSEDSIEYFDRKHNGNQPASTGAVLHDRSISDMLDMLYSY